MVVEKLMNTAAASVSSDLVFRYLFRRILDGAGLKASTVARELQRERSLMYKWLSGSSVPPSSYLPLLVEVLLKHTTQAKRLLLAEDLRRVVREAEMPGALRDTLLGAESFEDLLRECLDLSLVPDLAAAAPRELRSVPLGQWPVLLYALLAAVSGGLVWNALNCVFGWPYFMGSSGQGLRGWHALVWGVVTMAPIPAPLLLPGPRQERSRMVLPAILFTLAGVASALLFYSSGIRETIEGLGLGYALREAILVTIFALILSIPPHLAALLAFRRRRGPARLMLLLLAPTAAALLGFLVTLLVDRPVSEVLQLRGLVVAFALRLAQVVTLYVTLRPSG
jgi:hypothetical protein